MKDTGLPDESQTRYILANRDVFAGDLAFLVDQNGLFTLSRYPQLRIRFTKERLIIAEYYIKKLKFGYINKPKIGKFYYFIVAKKEHLNIIAELICHRLNNSKKIEQYNQRLSPIIDRKALKITRKPQISR